MAEPINTDYTINDLKTKAIDALYSSKDKHSAEETLASGQLASSHALISLENALTFLIKKGAKLQKAKAKLESIFVRNESSSNTGVGSSSMGGVGGSKSSDSSNSTTTQGTNYTYGGWGQPVKDSCPGGNTDVPDDQDAAEKKLEQMISWQRGNFDDPSRMATLLQYMINFQNKFPNDPVLKTGGLMPGGSSFNDLEQTLIINLVANQFVLNGDGAARNEMTQLKAELGSKAGMFSQYLNPDLKYYTGRYTNSDGSRVSPKVLELMETSDMAKAAQNDMNPLMQAIYSERLGRITSKIDGASVLNGDFAIFMALVMIVMEKENDTQNEVAGCANMLKELGFGESTTGNATDSLSKIVNELTGDKSGDITNINSFLTEANTQWNNPAIKLKIEQLPLGSQTELSNLHQSINAIPHLNGAFSWQSATLAQKNAVIANLNTINNDPDTTAKDFIEKDKKLNVGETIDSMNDELSYSTQSEDAAQKLSLSLLLLQQMGNIFDDSIFPGLKDITDQLMGDFCNTGKDGTQITPEILQQASKTDGSAETIAAQNQVIDGIKRIVPINDKSDTGQLTSINNDLGKTASYFNDHNSSEQADAQYISSNDEKMLSFIKSLFDTPTKFTTALQSNLQRSGQ